MRMKRAWYLTIAAGALAMVSAGSAVTLSAQPAASEAVRIDSDDIGGVVAGPNGPEAGVWVIAETSDLPTKFAKIVVTDDRGRYVVPDLPKAKYKVWARGYGLVDSAKVDGEPGKLLNLRAIPAPSAAAAAQYYPALYWYSMLKIPDASQFGGTSNIPAKITQSDWLTVVKNRSCVGCHQLGQLSTRTIPAALGQFESSDKAWIRRVQSGQAAPLMLNPLTGVLGGAPFKYFGDWTDRIAKGELPHSKPPRPQGVERNIVVTTWEGGDPKKSLHDLIASDRRYPTVNAYGKLYGSPEYATDEYPILDPRTHTVTTFRAPVRDADTPEALGPGHAAIEKPMAPSPYWGEEKIWDTKANNHNRMFDETGDAAKSQGWTAFVLDTNGNGKRDDYVEPDQPVDPTKDKRIAGGFYAVMPSPIDGSIWGSVAAFGGTAAVVRLAPGSNPPATALAEIYNVPKPYFGIRGADIDKQGVVWASMGSGHIGSFDRRKCKGPLNGPKATGDHCPEGWAFYRYPGPGFQGIGDNSAESSYYTWVDQHNTFGLGDDVPMSTANLNDGLVALKDGKMILLTVPYPLGFYAKGFDGRIDDPRSEEHTSELQSLAYLVCRLLLEKKKRRHRTSVSTYKQNNTG